MLVDSLLGDFLNASPKYSNDFSAVIYTRSELLSYFRVKSVKDLQMNVNLCNGKFHGRVHVTKIWDEVVQVRKRIGFLQKLTF